MPSGRAGQADLGEAGADRRLAGDEGGAAGGAALLAVPVGEQRALLGDAVDVGRPVAHHAVVVGADVELADVVAPDDEDVRLGRRPAPMPALASAAAAPAIASATPATILTLQGIVLGIPVSSTRLHPQICGRIPSYTAARYAAASLTSVPARRGSRDESRRGRPPGSDAVPGDVFWSKCRAPVLPFCADRRPGQAPRRERRAMAPCAQATDGVDRSSSPACPGLAHCPGCSRRPKARAPSVRCSPPRSIRLDGRSPRNRGAFRQPERGLQPRHRLSGDALFPLRVAQAMRPEDYGPLVNFALEGTTLRRPFRRICRLAHFQTQCDLSRLPATTVARRSGRWSLSRRARASDRSPRTACARADGQFHPALRRARRPGRWPCYLDRRPAPSHGLLEAAIESAGPRRCRASCGRLSRGMAGAATRRRADGPMLLLDGIIAHYRSTRPAAARRPRRSRR